MRGRIDNEAYQNFGLLPTLSKLSQVRSQLELCACLGLDHVHTLPSQFSTPIPRALANWRSVFVLCFAMHSRPTMSVDFFDNLGMWTFRFASGIRDT